MSKDDRTDHNPEDAATYVRFEHTQLTLVVKALRSLRAESRADSQGGQQMADPKQFQENILLASFLIHTRNLRDFLFTPPRLDDVSAKDFLAEWDESVETWCPYLDENRDRLNKSLAHLSYKRIEYEPNKSWDCGTIYKELTAAWNEFWSRLPSEKKEWFTRPRNPQP